MCFSKSTFFKEPTFNFRSLQLLISFNDNITHLHLLFFININVKNDLILLAYVLTLSYFYVCILKAFVVKIFLCKNFCTVNHIGCNLSAFKNAKLLLHIVALAFLQTNIVNLRNAWAWLKGNVQIYFISNNRIGRNLDIREQTMVPITLYSLSNFVTWNGYVLPNGKTRNTSKHIILVAVHSRNIKSADY